MNNFYNYFHKNPEIGGEEKKTAEKISNYLSDIGVEILGDKIGGEGIVALIKGNIVDGPTIALRADMDALPIAEQAKENGLPVSDVPGMMHACGHDIHTSGLLGAAKILKSLSDEKQLNGNVLLIFQSNEEKAKIKKDGAVAIIRFLEEQGIRKNIDTFFGLHVAGFVERGTVIIKDGIQMASANTVKIKLEGAGGHQMDIRTLPDIDAMMSALKLELSDLFEPLYESGEAMIESVKTDYPAGPPNILPKYAEKTFVIRISSANYKEINKDVLSQIDSKAQEVVDRYIKKSESMAEKKGVVRPAGQMEVKISISQEGPGYRPVVHRDANLIKMTELIGQKSLDNFKLVNKSIPASEDFSFYLENFRGKEIPGVYVSVGGANLKKGFPPTMNHASNFQVDPNVVSDVAKFHSIFALSAIEKFKK